MKLDIETLTGSTEDVLAEMLEGDALNGLGEPTVQLAMAAAGSVAQKRALRMGRELISAQLASRLQLHAFLNGEYEGLQDGFARNDWEAAADDIVEAVMEPFVDSLSASYLGNATIDTRLHEPGAVERIADTFARELWKQATWDAGSDDGANYRPGQPLTQNRILSRIGIVPDTVAEALKRRKPKTPKDIEMSKKEMVLRLNAGIKARGSFDAVQYCAELEEAADSDDGLAQNAMARLGGLAEDVATLRGIRDMRGIMDTDGWHALALEIEAADNPAGVPAAEPSDSVVAAPAPVAPPAPPVPPAPPAPVAPVAAPPAPPVPAAPVPASVPAAPTAEPAEAADFDLSSFFGGDAAPAAPVAPPAPPVPHTAPGAFAPVPAAPTPPSAPAAPAAPKSRKARAKDGSPHAPYAVQAADLAMLADTIGMKTEDLAAGIGVSRATFVNYRNGKAFFVPEPRHVEFLMSVIDKSREQLEQVRRNIEASQEGRENAG